MLRAFGFVSACVLVSGALGAQTFEVASIKPSPPMNPDRPISGVQTPGGGRLNAISTSLRMLITYAYDVKDDQVSGGPGWASSETYDIVAKGDGNATRPQVKLMLQALLKDRFKLVLRRETRDAPIYELVVAKGGSKMQEDTESPGQRMAITGAGKFMVQKTSMAMFAGFLGRSAGRPVVDKTGLSSTYTFKLDWTPDPGQGGPPGLARPDAPPPDSNGPSLFTALQDQLGLRLQSAKGPVESLVIEKVEKPTEN
jgi:bla regulator protein blaR1